MALKINIPPPPSVRATTQFVGAKTGSYRYTEALGVPTRNYSTISSRFINHFLPINTREGSAVYTEANTNQTLTLGVRDPLCNCPYEYVYTLLSLAPYLGTFPIKQRTGSLINVLVL